MEQEFTGEIIEWRGPAPYYFVPVPEQECAALRTAASGAGYGWGTLPIRAQLGNAEWKTVLWPKDGSYLLPLKDAVRKPAGLDAGDAVDIRLTFDPMPQRQKRPVKRASVPRTPGSREPITAEQLRIIPANEAAWEDLQAVFGVAGETARCWCQRFRMLPKESFASEGPEELAARLRDQTACGNGQARATTGLVAYLDGEPVGWCAVAPRADHPRLLRDYRVPWLGRDEDKADSTVWAVTCFVTRVGYRRRGVGRALAGAAVGFAREGGARAVEGYPDLVDGGYVGTLAMFTDAGFAEVSRPGNRRAVLRIDF
ncbi:acetyltransferase (GNAT) family protein [Kribbella voronezhensis]|uniref:Acetyltransferase (GNAT) family protein n=1 Tax=Kribbella voronezhensis TaxID=2512212 RepID=A0A4R7T6B1_9ACTN|nr:GNAT family N-acetyltransferase [Kribbella voronezhensis]TDU86618.1 acetyltransferase (GNAT) family protein [Kribbella voronezhensis]